jgi:hypothetical protein
VGLEARQESTQPRFIDRVDVSRVVIDVRVLDDRNNPVVGLESADFSMKYRWKASACRVGALGRRRRAAAHDR